MIAGFSASSLLVVRGAKNTDELAQLGLPFAERFQRAECVVLVGPDGRGRAVKGKVSGEINFVDVDSRLDRLTRILERVADGWRDLYPKEAHLSHALVGKFLMYGHYEVSDDRPVAVMDLIRAGDLDSVEKTAEHFISSGYENFYARSATLCSRERHADAAETATELPDDAVPSASGVGKDDRRDRGRM